MSLITTPSASAVIGCAIAVHRELGAGLFESVYQPCLAYELRTAGLRFREQVIAPVKYRDVVLPRAFKIDLVVEDDLIVEVKAVERLLAIHDAQVLTYMKRAGSEGRHSQLRAMRQRASNPGRRKILRVSVISV